MHYKLFLVLPIIFASFFVSSAFAESKPALATAVSANPFYWSEGGFGIDVLRSFQVSLDPYLTPGVTADSTTQEILEAYLAANQDKVSTIVGPEDERAQTYVVRFSGGIIAEDDERNCKSSSIAGREG